MPEKGSEVVDVEVEVTVDREASLKVISCQTNRTAWVPKSLVTIHGYDTRKMLATLTMPTWMAKEKDLI